MTVTYTSGANLRFSMISVKNGSATDLYMRIMAPKQNGWGAVGIGDQMIGSKIFLTYPSADGKSSTLSVRHATALAQPQAIKEHNCQVQEAMTTDSIINTAFVCYGEGDDAELQSNPAAASWIWAVGPGVSVTSNSVRAQIEQHSHEGVFQLNMNQAQQAMTAKNIIAPEIGTHSDLGSSTSNIMESPSETLIKAHAVLLGLAFLIFFPLGIFLLRFGSVRLHWMTQVFAFILAFCGWIIAIVMCTESEEYADFKVGHQIVGLVAVALLFPQLVFGFFHHWQYRKNKSDTWMRIPHINLGRIAMILGLINGILGFLLKEDTTGAIVYGVFAAVVFFAVIGVAAWSFVRKGHSGTDPQTPLAKSEKVYN